jgi:hypothetical protein
MTISGILITPSIIFSNNNNIIVNSKFGVNKLVVVVVVYLTIDTNEKYFVNGTPTWRRRRHVQTKTIPNMIAST